MIQLTDGMIEAHNKFIKSLPESKREAAREALGLLLCSQVYPFAADWATVEDLQKAHDYLNNPGEDFYFPTDSSLTLKLMYLLDEFENKDKDFCMAVLFLCKFYIFLSDECPEFVIPVGTLYSDEWIEMTRVLARVSDILERFGGLPMVEVLKTLMNRIIKQTERKRIAD